ncbi:unnamed protein product [Dracunculus medinensis]|uniref:Integrin_alpha2 domain-containing protein n=1 Tax=Dracunculus medinensis TaxID=318479 RepID=A0A158Q537_DRAME|nr:unnamed protein product [Dracunculus medinensis]
MFIELFSLLYLRLITEISITLSFNIDIHSPVFKYGLNGTYFGFAVAQHYNGIHPIILVGAPRAESGQPYTRQAGALFSCPINTIYFDKSKGWCKKEIVEYVDKNDLLKPVGYVHGKQLHYQGKNRQLLGSVVVSSAVPNGIAMVCAPLVRYHNTSAYTDGTCFVLESDLNQKEMLISCAQPGLPRTDRHNEYGSCMEGFSGYVDESMVITGLPGAKKWTGGVFSRYYPKDIFAMNLDRWTMGVEPKYHGVRSKFQGHDYLGFSVNHGRFGFWFEDDENSTIVSGATRYNQTGAVTFLPFRRSHPFGSPESHHLTLTDDSFMLLGTQLGSSFGYSIEVNDLNNDGFDDLLIGAPFEYMENTEQQYGGAVYIFFSSGKKRSKHENSKVFLEPIKIRGPDIYSQFGLSITSLGNIDDDVNKFNDFAVGAPYANGGEGAVYIYHGSKSPKDFKDQPAQVILASDIQIPVKSKLRSFGFSLSGGIDMDGNGYGDLLVGAFASDAVVLLRSRPVINIQAKLITDELKIDIDGDSSCYWEAQTCFSVTTELSVDSLNSRSTRLLDFSTNVFECMLEVVPLNVGIGSRARIVSSGDEKYTWNCGRNNKNSDWINAIKLRFSVRLRNDAKPTLPKNGEQLIDLNNFPVLNKFGSEDFASIHFNKKCGLDNICTCDLQLQSVLPGISKADDSTYMTQVGEKASIDISFVVSNFGERAYEAQLFIDYNSNELDVPVLSKKTGPVNIKSVGENYAVVSLGNPMEPRKQLKFELSFKLARGRTEGLGKPLEFRAHVNSTSEETDLSNNFWDAIVRVIKRAELELTGVSEPPIVRYGGEIRGESAMEFDEDIGVLVTHKYTVTNKGPWSVSNALIEIDWPYQVASVFPKGKWALYLLEIPTVQTMNTDNTKEIKQCSMALPTEWVNPLQLKLFLDAGVSFNYDDKLKELEAKYLAIRNHRSERSVESEETLRPSRELRIKTISVKEKSGEEVQIVRVSCAEYSAKCFTVTCSLDFLDVDATAVMEFRARLWNATFVEDYYDVTYVEISSSGRLLLDPEQGIEEDTSNNFAFASTHAYPDRPAIQEMAPIPWWLIAAAVVGGLFILFILILIFWKCGFFKRNRPSQPMLHQAEYQFRQEEWAEN